MSCNAPIDDTSLFALIMRPAVQAAERAASAGSQASCQDTTEHLTGGAFHGGTTTPNWTRSHFNTDMSMCPSSLASHQLPTASIVSSASLLSMTSSRIGGTHSHHRGLTSRRLYAIIDSALDIADEAIDDFEDYTSRQRALRSAATSNSRTTQKITRKAQSDTKEQ